MRFDLTLAGQRVSLRPTVLKSVSFAAERSGNQQLANCVPQNPSFSAGKPSVGRKKMTLLQALFRPWIAHPVDTVAFASEKQPQKNRA
jgi:hypothetical protein